MKQDMKWGAAALDARGRIFFLPGCSSRVLCVDPQEGKIREIGAEIEGSGKKKDLFAGAVVGTDGCIYGVPFEASRVLRLDPETDEIEMIVIEGLEPKKPGLWGEGVLCDDGKIYCAPAKATQILCIDPAARQAFLVGSGLPQLDGVNKWWGAALAAGHVFFLPQNHGQVLCFDPKSGEHKLIGMDMATQQIKYSGACTLDGLIYGAPYDSDRVLCVDPVKMTSYFVGPNLSENHRFGKFVVGSDNLIYGIPRYAARVLRFDPAKGTADMIGDKLDGHIHKYNGGALAKDGFLYCAPYAASSLLRINTVQQLGESNRMAELWTGEQRIFQKSLTWEWFRPDILDWLSHELDRFGAGAVVRMLAEAAEGRAEGDGTDDQDQLFEFDLNGKFLDWLSEMKNPEARAKLVDPLLRGMSASPPKFSLAKDMASNSIGLIPSELGETQQKNQWMGAALAKDGRIFSVPRTAREVLYVDTVKGRVGLLESQIQGDQAYYDAIAATTNCIYGVPFDAPRVLCIDPLSNSVTFIGRNLGNSRFKWGCGMQFP